MDKLRERAYELLASNPNVKGITVAPADVWVGECVRLQIDTEPIDYDAQIAIYQVAAQLDREFPDIFIETRLRDETRFRPLA